MANIRSMFQHLLLERGLMITDVQLDQFETYFNELVSWNEKMNLTAITDREQVFIKHFYDSLSVSFFHPFSEVESLADIGSGAGFPSLPLKIMFPHLQVTIVDSLQKRIRFLEFLKCQLELNKISCIHGRAEDIARLPEHRERYDVVTARAVARLNVLSEFCLPFVRPNGFFIAMKGSDPMDEINEARFAIKELGGQFIADESFELPMDHSNRHIFMIKKVKKISKLYPRKAGIPLKNPLLDNEKK